MDNRPLDDEAIEELSSIETAPVVRNAKQEESDPLEVTYNNETVIENGAIKLGALIESNREDEDWHEYSLNLINHSSRELRGIRIETNMSDELFAYKLPESLGGNQSCPGTIRVRASKVLEAKQSDGFYINIKYREVSHY